ncbi:MAG: FkbM family methyltransferase [Alphaproteobacteria bacterium]|nr:FkbM family methyltransferase [Alphaproteobacteria bacterium]
MPSPNIVVHSQDGPIIININDQIIGQSILKTGGWERQEINLIIRIIENQFKNKEQLIFYDVGANIGTHSLALAKHFGPKIKIRAFEAQRPIFNMLNGTLALNGVLSVITHNVAVSDKGDETIQIRLPDYTARNNFGGLELMAPQLSDNKSMSLSSSEDIKTVTLDDFDEPVDFIKMDIEGMEDRALRGATTLFKKNQPLAFIEILKTDRLFISDFFRSRSYQGFEIGGNLLALPENVQIKFNGARQLF